MSRFFMLENIIDRKALLNLTWLFSSEEGTCLFYSGGQYETAKYSYLCLLPYDFISIQGHKQKRYYSDGEKTMALSMENPWDALKLMLSDLDKAHQFPEWVGFLGYEMGAYSDQAKRFNTLSSKTPEAYFQRCAIVLVVDHHQNTGTVWITAKAEYFLNEKQRVWFEQLSHPSHWESLIQSLSNCGWHEPNFSSLLVHSFESEDSYVKKVEQAKELIRSGEIYQVNLSQKIDLQGSVDNFQLFYHLNSINPAPFSAFLNLRDLAIVSMSPERFLKKVENSIESRPIKGTFPRGKTSEEDEQNKANLIGSEKERAELLMITDLMRNDLGRISVAGSVKTSSIWECESYSNVFHLSSTIRSQLLPNLHPIDIVRACFPGGSITGCPKLSAMQVIADLEKRSRGIYTGAIGYFGGNGDFDFNIAIRTLVATEDLLSVQLGGAIVADSNPKKEYEETYHKGSSIFKALNLNLFPK